MKKRQIHFWKQALIRISRFIAENKLEIILFLIIFSIFIALRFYQLEQRTEFRWDQVDNAWAAKDILIDGKLPLVGMVAKQNTGFFIGPLYYYFITPFYWFFNLDPIASGVISRITGIITFIILYLLTKKIFSKRIALFAIFLYTFSFNLTIADSFQWPINFIAPVSFLIFYFLYKVLSGKEKYIIPLAFSTGLAFHLNFTAIFFPIIILCCLPFFPRKRQTVPYLLACLFLFSLLLLPNVIFELQNKAASTKHMIDYLGAYYHGFHLRRFIQIMPIALVQQAAFFSVFKVNWVGYGLVPVFLIMLWLSKKFEKKNIIIFLVLLWIIIPWIVFSTYTGEITDYYFSLSIPIVLIAFSFILNTVLQQRKFYLSSVVFIVLFLYTVVNLNSYFTFRIQGLDYHKTQVKKAINEGKNINFTQGDPQSYIYYIYKQRKK